MVEINIQSGDSPVIIYIWCQNNVNYVNSDGI